MTKESKVIRVYDLAQSDRVEPVALILPPDYRQWLAGRLIGAQRPPKIPLADWAKILTGRLAILESDYVDILSPFLPRGFSLIPSDKSKGVESMQWVKCTAKEYNQQKQVSPAEYAIFAGSRYRLMSKARIEQDRQDAIKAELANPVPAQDLGVKHV